MDIRSRLIRWRYRTKKRLGSYRVTRQNILQLAVITTAVTLAAGALILSHNSDTVTVTEPENTRRSQMLKQGSERDIWNATFVSYTEETLTVAETDGTKRQAIVDQIILAEQNSISPDQLTEGDEILVYVIITADTATVERIRLR